ERGQAEAIARNLVEMATLRTPILTAVIGEGGSGGALAVGLADRVLMLENSVYSVISPEGCAAILWKDASQRERAAEALRITAEALGETLRRYVRHLRKVRIEKLLKRREEKYLSMGALSEK